MLVFYELEREQTSERVKDIILEDIDQQIKLMKNLEGKRLDLYLERMQNTEKLMKTN